MRIFITALLLGICFHVSGQPSERALKYYDKGMKAFEKDNLEDAIKYFSESISIHPLYYTFYARAQVYQKLNKRRENCEDLSRALSLRRSDELFATLRNECYTSDTVFMDINHKKTNDSLDHTFREIVSISELLGIKEYALLDKNRKEMLSFCISNGDTVYGMYNGALPQFEGGESQLVTFLSENIEYPSAARVNKITGTVFVTFVVDETGTIKDIGILRGIGAGCDEESMRVIAKMPNWKPGVYEGRNVSVRFNLPIRYTLR